MVPVSDLSPLTSENVNFLDDEYSPKVTGQIVNPYDVKLEYVQVVVIAYDADGNIIGGGTGGITYSGTGALTLSATNGSGAATRMLTVETPWPSSRSAVTSTTR
jgi:hypothetical protein